MSSEEAGNRGVGAAPVKRTVNVIVAGLGGQGVIKASDILADAAFRAGLDVKKAEVHGMSQRGGSVTSDVRFGETVHSPMIPTGEADFLVVLEPSEVPVTLPLLAPGGVLIPPDAIPPGKLANKRSLNVALLGMLAARLEIPEEHWTGGHPRGASRAAPRRERRRLPARAGDAHPRFPRIEAMSTLANRRPVNEPEPEPEPERDRARMITTPERS